MSCRLLIALAMYCHEATAQVVAHLDIVSPDEVNPDIATSALTPSRQRLGKEPLSQLFNLCAQNWYERHQQHPGRRWRGLNCCAIEAIPCELQTPRTIRTIVRDATSTQLGFKRALHCLRYEWSWMAGSSVGVLPARLLRLREHLDELLPPKKTRGHSCPRVVKKSSAHYPIRQVRA